MAEAALRLHYGIREVPRHADTSDSDSTYLSPIGRRGCESPLACAGRRRRNGVGWFPVIRNGNFGLPEGDNLYTFAGKTEYESRTGRGLAPRRRKGPVDGARQNQGTNFEIYTVCFQKITPLLHE